MRHKSEVPQLISSFKAQVENVLGTTIKTLCTDGGREYKPISTLFPQLILQTSCPYTPQQNGTAERKHRHLTELALATMSHASIPQQYWDEVFTTVVYLINRLPSNHIIPYKKLFNRDPDFLSLQVLGCLCFPLTRPYNSGKLELCSLPCVFMGYALSQKGYKCLHLPSNKLYVSRHVQFEESRFSFKEAPAVSGTDAPFPTSIPLPLPLLPASSSISASISSPPAHVTPFLPSSPPPAAPAPSSSPILPLSPDPLSPPHPVIPSAPSHNMVTRTRDNSRKPRMFNDYVAHLAALETEPTCFSQAKLSSNWRAAMATESQPFDNKFVVIQGFRLVSGITAVR